MNKNLYDLYKSLPGNRKAEFKQAVCREMGFGTDSFYKKFKGERGLSNSELIVLSMIFSRYGVKL